MISEGFQKIDEAISECEKELNADKSARCPESDDYYRKKLWVLYQARRLITLKIGGTRKEETMNRIFGRSYLGTKEPLTREELLRMDGEPIWCVDGEGNKMWCLVDVAGNSPNAIDKENGLWDGDFYGMQDGKKLHRLGWIAYRKKETEA